MTSLDSEHDQDEFDGRLSPSDLAFVAALRSEVACWLIDPDALQIYPPEDELPLIAWLDISSPADNLGLLTIGVHLEGDHLRGDELHNQLLHLPEHPTHLAMSATGSPSEMARATADWFDEIRRRPIVRYEWLYDDKVYATRYLFADNGCVLSLTYNKSLAPPGQPERLIAEGHARGRGWFTTRGIGEPDRIVAVPTETK